MLSQISGEFIEREWDKAWPAIHEALPLGERNYNGLKENILQALKDGLMQLWILYDKDKKAKAVITTYLAINNNIGIKELFIYSFYSFEALTPDEFKQGWFVLFEYASLCGCNTIGAFTNVESIKKFAEHSGGFVTTKITIPIARRS